MPGRYLILNIDCACKPKKSDLYLGKTAEFRIMLWPETTVVFNASQWLDLALFHNGHCVRGVNRGERMVRARSGMGAGM